MTIKFLESKQLKDFPSGSGIAYFEEKLYLVGDDSPAVLVMNKKWKALDKTTLFNAVTDRFPKKIKGDLEATTIIQGNKTAHLLMLGSGSREQYRNKAILLNLSTLKTEEFDLRIFYDRLKQEGLPELQIEGAAVVDDRIILCNRGSVSNPQNCLIITTKDFWKKQADAEIVILKMEFEQPAAFLEVAGITYSKANDWLLFSAALPENGMTTLPDQKTGSYLGVIENVTRKIGRKKMKVNSLVKIKDASDKIFGRIQSLCVQRDKENNVKLHLVTVNDIAETCIYKVRLKA